MEAGIKLWAKHLHGIENEYVKRALHECSDKFAWCPDVAEFKHLAKSYRGSTNIPWAHEVMEKASAKKKNPDIRVEELIEAGAVVCSNLKKVFPDLNWYQIADKFTELKKKTRKFYPNADDVKLCRELQKYTPENLLEALQ